MSEGMHSTSGKAGVRSRKRLVLIVASTALAAVAIGVSIQFFRPETGTAGQEGAGTSSTARASAPSDHLARVGDIIITRDMVANECLDRYKFEVLEKMINRALIEQACHERGITVSEREVAAEIGKIAQKFNLDPAAWLSMLKAERGISQEQYARDIIWPMLALKKMAGSEVVVTDEDKQKGFMRNYGPRVECKLIMFDNVRRAQEVWKQAQETPEEFGALARQHSIEPTSRALDGDVPPIRMYGGNDQIEKVAFKLKKGEISGITEIGTVEQKRYVILYCKGRTQQLAKMEDVQAELYAQLQEEKMQEAVGKVFEEIRGKTKVVNYLSNTVAGPSAETGIQRASGYAGPAPKSADPRSAAPRTSAQPKTTTPR